MTFPKKSRTGAQRAHTAPTSATPGNGSGNPVPPATPAAPRPGTKIAVVLDLLRRPGGATIADIGEATGWQSHTVRGALAGAIGRRMGLKVTSHKEAGEARRYRLAD